ncbi:hypothetical protein BC477_09090 [Clavibacter michiganensis subsp. michiganensis]|uniref:Uncharacterized protein n=1 Tax=Clavibacter michiganensis subsp. michiganensis TaxID=33013 RepID=A0A251XNW0_CLAMM|nr:hypothetical protein BC477_09090 [Clavibacter michiganensis subsp. michiganensis]OUE04879.1 hypothetical protein CMMCAS07_08015 [Clavibacter michiganensis subsp. michiganensis]
MRLHEPVVVAEAGEHGAAHVVVGEDLGRGPGVALEVGEERGVVLPVQGAAPPHGRRAASRHDETGGGAAARGEDARGLVGDQGAHAVAEEHDGQALGQRVDGRRDVGGERVEVGAQGMAVPVAAAGYCTARTSTPRGANGAQPR